MSLLDKSDEELLEIAQPMWDNLIHCSNKQDYFGFTQNFSARMLFGANEIELAKQWANNDVITSLTEEREFLGCLRRDEHCLLYTSPSPRDRTRSRMPSSA